MREELWNFLKGFTIFFLACVLYLLHCMPWEQLHRTEHEKYRIYQFLALNSYFERTNAMRKQQPTVDESQVFL